MYCLVFLGSPPHTWRILWGWSFIYWKARITSTYVENTFMICGLLTSLIGSPPHTWRIHIFLLAWSKWIRITSTYVENTLKDPLSLSHFNFMKTKIYSVSSYLFYSFLFISSTHFKFFLPNLKTSKTRVK